MISLLGSYLCHLDRQKDRDFSGRNLILVKINKNEHAK